MLNITKASAGSGKTYTLAYEYIKLILGYKDMDGVPHLHNNMKDAHQHILAITFTNKATEEMKQRIVKELSILAHPTDHGKSDYMPQLTKYYNVSSEKISNAADKALKDLLHNFSAFNVSTIDSFFQNILRTFAREAEINYDYDIELRDDFAVKMGINTMLSSLNRNADKADTALIEWIKTYLKSRVEDGKFWNVFQSGENGSENSLSNLAGFLKTETYKQHSIKINQYLSDPKRIYRFIAELKKKIEIHYDAIHRNALDFIEIVNMNGLDMDMTKGAVSNHIKKFAAIRNPDVPLNVHFNFTKSFIKDSVDNIDTWVKKANIDRFSQIFDNLKEKVGAIFDENACISTYNMILGNIYALGLLGYIDRNIDDFRKENDLILLSDTNQLLRRIINEDDTPFIYERVGMMLRNFLIDEFQDTSRMQWENMKPLLSESLSADNDNLIIGDVKQSIYRFRNADSSLLQEKVYLDFARFIPESSKQVQCSTNWRSSANVIKFNNTLFSFLPEFLDNLIDAPNLKNIYREVVQKISSKNVSRAGHVKIMNITLTEEENAENKDIKEKALDEMVATIYGLLEHGYKMKDIAILVNTHKDGAKVIERILAPSNADISINVISDESLLLKNSIAVRNVMSILKYIDSSNMIKGEDGKVHEKITSNDIIPILMHKYNSLLNDSTRNLTPSQALGEIFNSPIEEFDTSPSQVIASNSGSLYTITESLFRNFVPSYLLERENSFIQAFQDIVIDFSSRNGTTIHNFIVWWEGHANKLSVNSPADIDAVNVMTIHKSKGLEFPCVIIPFGDWDMNDQKGLLWAPPPYCEDMDQEIVPPLVPVNKTNALMDTGFKDVYRQETSAAVMDSMNKTYVACTRAIDELIVIMPSNERKEKSPTAFRNLVNSIVSNCDESNLDYINENINKITDCNAEELTLPLSNYFSDGILEIGCPTVKQEENLKTVENVFDMPPYSTEENSISLKFDLPDIINDSPRTIGVLYHKILSMITTVDNIKPVIDKCVARGIIESDNVNTTYDFISTILNDEKTRKWFSSENRIMNERPISIDGKVYRPDRIVITPENETLIIDYKFGEKHSKSYTQQLANYINIFREAGFENVTGYLWYPLEGEIEKVN